MLTLIASVDFRIARNPPELADEASIRVRLDSWRKFRQA
jgi:hypothetical protein